MEDLARATQAALEAGDWSGLVELWMDWEEAGERERMVELLEEAAGRGHGDAMWLLARQGAGEESAGRMERAAEMGSVPAQRELGVMYATGDGVVERDLEAAARWYRLAAEGGDAESQYDLGLMLLLGEGGAKNVEEGLRWLERAGEQAEGDALRVLVDCYEEGRLGVGKDAEKAALWRERLAEHERRFPPRSCRLYTVEGIGREEDWRWLLEIEGVEGYSIVSGEDELAVGYAPEVIGAGELDERVGAGCPRARAVE